MTPLFDDLPEPPLLIGLVGRAGSGKSTVAGLLAAEYGMLQMAFADPVLDMICALFEAADIDGAHAVERHLKEAPTALGYSYRHLAQTLGTEWGRHTLAPDFWVRVLARRANAVLAIGDSVVVSDVRYDNEAAWLTERGGVLVRVLRDDAEPVREHDSERAADTLPVSHTLYNSGSFATLADQVDRLMATLRARSPA